MRLLTACLLLGAWMSQAVAASGTINLTTNQIKYSKWTVYEITNGNAVSGAPVFLSPIYHNTWGNLPSITIPFTNCDGYWYAERTFKLPAKATNAILKITRIGADDRIVVELNGASVISAGTGKKGDGDMQFTDPGENKPHHFEFESGPVRVSDTRHLQPGVNKIRVYVNNTFNGIYGTIMPVNSGDPSEFGIEAKVTYTTP